MKIFHYIIKDELGIHARPAGLLVKEAGKYQSEVKIKKDGKEADAKRIFSVMSLACKCGEEIVITVEGPDEVEAARALETFIEKNM